MQPAEHSRRLERAHRPLGERGLTVTIGNHAIRIEGLDARLVSALERRWGGFVSDVAPAATAMTIQAFAAGPGGWLPPPRAGELYRLESVADGASRVVLSYHFALAATAEDRWRLAITDEPDEPRPRILDNALRFVVARLALRDGGFALHSAAVLRDGLAYVVAGPSRAGKSTATRLLAPAIPLGDDFGVVLPTPSGWCAPAVPFDNSERIAHEPPRGLHPVAGIWRLHHAGRTRVEPPPAGQAVASLMACTAFPWAIPEQAPALLAHVDRFVREATFRHLFFTRDAALWSVLVR